MQNNQEEEQNQNLDLDSATIQTTQSRAFGPRGLEIGSLVEGKYRITEVLGSGGMGIVYKVDQIFLGRQLALKTLNSEELTESAIRRFRAEAQLLALLDHPGLVKVRDFGMLDFDRPFLVIDFVDGKTLASFLKEKGTLSLELFLKIFAELCFALAYAHSRGIIHRDIKPSNIMLTAPGIYSAGEHVKLLDFGIAKLRSQHLQVESLTGSGEVLGSPMYMSPEQCRAHVIDHRTDIYSMGCVMYEALTGAPPFSGQTALSTMMLHQAEKPMSLKAASLGKEYAREIEDMIEKMLEKDADDRYQNFLEVAAVLSKVQEGTAYSEADTRTVDEMAPTPKQIDRLLSIKICVGLALTFTLWMLLQNNAMKSSYSSEMSEMSKTVEMNWSHLSADGNTKIFLFSENLFLGNIEYMVGTHKVVTPAQGKQTFPSNARLTFFPSAQFLSHPQFFKRFRPDDLYGLHIKDNRVNEDFTINADNVLRLTDEELVYVSNLTDLSSLTVSGWRISDRGLRFIENLEHLKCLRVGRTDVTVGGLKRMRCLNTLETLEADYICSNGEIVDVLRNCESFIELTLLATGLKDDQVSQIAKLTKLRYLDLSLNPELTDLAVSHLVPLKNLETLNIADGQITPSSLKYFKQLRLTVMPKLSLGSWSLVDREALSKSLVMTKVQTAMPSP